MEQNDAVIPRVDLIARLTAIPGSAQVEERCDGLWMLAPQLDVEAMAREMKALGCRLVTMTGLARDDGETTIIYHYARRHEAINFKTATSGGAIRSLAPMLRPASWIEREIHDFFAVDFVGHPNLIPLIRPPELKDGFFRDPDPSSITPAKQ
jgi:NADH:ubiquinone oxidoreductase subunit C